MHDQTTSPADADAEALIERKLTFRNSTYGGLKSFIRAHKRRTGIDLSNSSAVDLLLRERLARELHPAAFEEVLKLSRAGALQALQAIHCGATEDGSGRAPAAPESCVRSTEAPTPVPNAGTVNINVSVSGPRSFVRRGAV